MAIKSSTAYRRNLVKDTVRRFYHLPALTIARHLVANYGPEFDHDLEQARTAVRYVLGKSGAKNRDKTKDKELFRDTVVPMPKTWRKPRVPYHLDPGLWLILSDIHIPFHEPDPLEAAIEWGQANNVDGVFLNGDCMEQLAMSFWPTAKRDFDSEVELQIDFLDFLRQQFPGKKIIYKPGNHEYRMPQYYVSHAPELATSPLAAMELVLGLEERNIEFLDFYQLVYAGKLPIIHGHEVRNLNTAVNPARGLALKAKTFCACSHCHRTSEHTGRDIIGNVITTWSFGCLCNLSPDFNPYCNDWNWGAGLINIHKGGGFEVENRRIMTSGKLK